MNRRVDGPPEIDGYTPLRLIGSGGYADVFTYQQRAPRRIVAVKVLAPPEEDAVEIAAAFEAEANYLAELSQHPSIVTIHDAGIARDGRPYMVMEFCSRPGLGSVYRRQRFTVAEVLRTGVRIAAAVETAHRGGILHRDIKPANVLVTAFGWPVLADFGIAAAVGEESAMGMSVPWTAPEVLGGDPPTVRSDVYSLGATLYALLSQRSPFEIPGGSNDPYELLDRIQRGNPPPVGRADMPGSLEAVLSRALGPVAVRYGSASELGRALQQIERELVLPVTELELPTVDEPDARWIDQTMTRRRLDQRAPAATFGSAIQPWEATRIRPVVDVESAPSSPVSEVTTPRRVTRGGLAAGIAATVVVAAAVAGVVLLRDDDTVADPTPTASSTLEVGASVPSPISLTATRAPDGVEISWVNPEPLDGDRYAWYRSDVPGSPRAVVTETTVLVEAKPDEELCVAVLVVRSDGAASTNPGEVCTP